MKNKKLIIANWKMNPVSETEAKKLFLGIKKISSRLQSVQTVVCPPFLYINSLVDLYKGHRVAIGAQDAFIKNKGSFTGMISPEMLEDIGVDYVIIGHSERRALGEDNELISKKILASVRSGLKVILCVGERERNGQGEYFDFLEEQLLNSLDGISKNALKNVIVAYEPVWAISGNGENQAMTSEDIHEMTIFIKKVLSDKYGKKTKLPLVVYGGSVNAKNTKDILENGNVKGLLVGKASLNIKKFSEILKIANNL